MVQKPINILLLDAIFRCPLGHDLNIPLRWWFVIRMVNLVLWVRVNSAIYNAAIVELGSGWDSSVNTLNTV